VQDREQHVESEKQEKPFELSGVGKHLVRKCLSGGRQYDAPDPEASMPLSFVLLYIELAALFLVGGYMISSLFVPMVVPKSISSEQAVHLTL
jgi:hypothetical protein